MKVFTIGFTKKSAEVFFSKLSQAGVRMLVDVRLNNVSQLAGFSKRDDLRYFLKAICRIDYTHVPELAPTQFLLDEYKKRTHDWSQYEEQFLRLLAARRVEERVPKDLLENACLLCSEEKPTHCHRRLVVEYLNLKWGGIETVHL
ncbi:MAG: DUF488 family protein [Terriglobales bacterium]